HGFVGSQDANGIGIERNGPGLQVQRLRSLNKESHQVLMAQVHAIEVADRQRRPLFGTEALQLLSNQFTHDNRVARNFRSRNRERDIYDVTACGRPWYRRPSSLYTSSASRDTEGDERTFPAPGRPTA